jgi:plasmid stabilization system protein ParE
MGSRRRKDQPKRFSIRISSRAENDLLEIRDFIAESNPENALGFLRRLTDVIDGLGIMPARHPLAPERLRTGGALRNAIVGNYRIVFEIVDDEVHVHTVRHAARRPLEDR